MKVKTYKHKSLEEGLEDIKRDLGSEALILGTRSVSVRPRFGLFKRPAWEITAAVEERGLLKGDEGAAPVDEMRNNAVVGTGAAPLSPFNSPRSSTAAAVPALARDQRMDTLMHELTELKKSLRTLSKVIPAQSEFGGGLFTELVHQGIDHDAADHLVSRAAQGNPAPTELRDRVRRMIADQLIIAPPAELLAKTRQVSAFVGSTGVGKTTTIAKIAGHAAIRMKKRVALISTDMFRIGGKEQLARFSELLGIPTYGCSDVATLQDLVASLDDRDLILIDTPGSSPSDLARLAKLENVMSVANAKVHLVISATTRSEDITKIIIRFQRFKPNSVILTKMDETDSKGAVAADLLRNEIPVSYVANGQRVPEDLLIPTAEELARYVLPAEPTV
jgi:flagellar biosynthesis protein FlhF